MSRNRHSSNRELVDFKRLIELLVSNPALNKQFIQDPEGFLSARQLNVNPKLAVEGIIPGGDRQNHPYWNAFQQRIDRVHGIYGAYRKESNILDSSFRRWYQRQIAGYEFTCRQNRNKEGMFYAPIIFELSDGCSVGCDFCCLDAGKLKKVFPYTDETRQEWNQLLVYVKELIGTAAGLGVCYFATEPLDNPDYEQFLQDFRQVFGRYPQTTTAALDRNPKRSKALMKLLGEEGLGQASLRVSIYSLQQLERIHKEFSPEELEHVELLMNNHESAGGYSKSGRAMKLSEVLPEKIFVEDASSICGCGFVINMCRRTIMLVSPYNPDETHPMGMKVYDECEFSNVDDCKRKVREIIDRNMHEQVPIQVPFRLRTGITGVRKGFVFSLMGDGKKRSISLTDTEYSLLRDIIECGKTISDAMKSGVLNDFEKQQFIKKVQVMYDGGCLEEID